MPSARVPLIIRTISTLVHAWAAFHRVMEGFLQMVQASVAGMNMVISQVIWSLEFRQLICCSWFL